jgi:outer membrane lipoprotein-sorting protein
MKTKEFKLMIFLVMLGICISAFTKERNEKSTANMLAAQEDSYMFLYCGEINVTDGEIEFEGTTPVEPYINDIDIVVSNGNWVIEYHTLSAEQHIDLSEDHGSSDATVTILPDGTPGTYVLDFYLDNVKMTTLTIEVE